MHTEGRSDARHGASDDADAGSITKASVPLRRITVRVARNARQKKNHGLAATVSPADARKSKAGQPPANRAAPARGCPELDAMMHWCANVSTETVAARRITGGRDQQRGLSEQMKAHRRMCEAITVNTEARLQATLAAAPCVRQLATEGGSGPPVEKYPVAGEMCTKTQMLRKLRQARAAAAVKVKTTRARLGALFVKNAQAARPNMHVVLGCARGCAEQLAERHENWTSAMTAADDADDEAQQRQDAEGRRRAEQKLHECVLEMMDLPENTEVRAASQPRTTFPARPPGMNIMQCAEMLNSALSTWEINLAAAVTKRSLHTPASVCSLADEITERTRLDTKKSMWKTLNRAKKRKKGACK